MFQVALLALAFASSPGGTTTMCEVLSDPVRFDGKVLSITAEYRVWGESAELVDEKCRAPVKVRNKEYPAAITLVSTKLTGRLKTPVEFVTDESVWERLDRWWGSAEAQHGRLIITVSGRIDGLPWFVDRSTGDWKGYGHLNAYPAQMIIRNVELKEVRRQSVPVR